jgi:hypothetical protein
MVILFDLWRQLIGTDHERQAGHAGLFKPQQSRGALSAVSMKNIFELIAGDTEEDRISGIELGTGSRNFARTVRT